MDIEEALGQVLWAAEYACEALGRLDDYYDESHPRIINETEEAIKVIEKVRPLFVAMADYLTSATEDDRVTS